MYRTNNEVAPSAVWRVALYMRLSREDGNDESLSITNQRTILMQHIEENFGDEQFAIVDEYIDDGETGTDIARPQFKRMIEDVESGAVNCIIVKDLKRFMRNHAYQGFYLEQVFPKNDTRFITVSEPRLDTYRNPNAVYGFDVPMHGIMNDRFAQGTSEAVKRTFKAKTKQGQFIGPFCPYGYTKDPNNKNKLIVDEDAAKVVRDIFKWFLEGVSKCAIAKRLNDYGVPNPSNYKRQNGIKYKNPHQKENDDGLWSRMTISRMLANEVYIGVMIQGKQKVVSYKIHDRVSIPKEQWVRVQGAMPALISLEQFEKVQALVAKNTRVTKRSGTLTLLAGFLKCADCKKAMRRHSSGKSQSVKYYCRSHCDKGACSSHSISESDLETSVFKAIKAQMKLVENLREMIEHIHAKPSMNAQPGRLSAMIDAKRKELQKMKAINDEVYMDWKKRIIEQDSYDRIKEKNNRQINQINDAIVKMEEELRMCSDNTSSHPVFEAFAKYANIAQLDREVLAALIDVIYVHENKEITIMFRHDDSVQAVQGFIEDHLDLRKEPA